MKFLSIININNILHFKKQGILEVDPVVEVIKVQNSSENITGGIYFNLRK